GQLTARSGEAAAPCIPEAPADGRRRIDVDEDQRFLECRRPRDHAALLVENEAMPVEDELVLRPDGVDERDPARIVSGTGREHLFTLGPLTQMEGRGRDGGDDVRAG